MARNALIQLRRDTSTAWTSVNPILAAGEIGFETNTGKYKIGNGTSTWSSLYYAGAPLGATSGLIVKTNSGGELTTLAAGTTAQVLRGDGVWADATSLSGYVDQVYLTTVYR